MRYTITIQKMVAGIMFLLFAVSITPKQFLHDAITDHKHNSYITPVGDENLQTPKNNFQCDWQEQDIESSFIGEPGWQLEPPTVFYSSHFNSYIHSEYFVELFFSSLRGPPSQA